VAGWRVFLAGLLVVGLGAGLVYAVAFGGTAPAASVPTLAVAPSTAGKPAATTGLSVGSVGAATVTSTTIPVALPSSTSVPAPALAAMERALDAWGVFAVTGRMRDLGDLFVPGGPQRRQLRDEADVIRAAPLGLPPFEVTLSDVLAISTAETEVVFRAEVTWSREGLDPQSFTWDIQMQQTEGVWQLLTVEEIGVPAG
jgi:hypothetical protein